jgi:CheY-like chemotaxis protein
MARVLIIEDEPEISMILEEVLKEEGDEVTAVSDGISGLKQLRKYPHPDIVLIDLFIPGISGKDVIEAMRADPELMNIPVVIMTGAVPTLQDFPDDMKYQALLSKPFDLSEAIRIIHRLTNVSSPVQVALEHYSGCL